MTSPRSFAVCLGRLLACALAAAWISSASAQEVAGAYAFKVQGAQVGTQEGVVTLAATIDFRLSPAASEALENGVPLTFEVQIELVRHRPWWVDEKVARLSQRYRVRYHALSKRYLLTSLNTGEVRGYATAGGALRALGIIEGLPLIERRLLQDESAYQVWIRALLDIDDLPPPLKTVAYMSPQWRLVSEWFQWPLVF